MATRGEESEPVFIEGKDGMVIFHLDDGETLAFGIEELRDELTQAFFASISMPPEVEAEMQRRMEAA